jgi:hypothetical protein
MGALKVWNGSDWVYAGSAGDHGSLAGLADDDHTQYLLRSELGSGGGVDADTVDGKDSTSLFYPVGDLGSTDKTPAQTMALVGSANHFWGTYFVSGTPAGFPSSYGNIFGMVMEYNTNLYHGWEIFKGYNTQNLYIRHVSPSGANTWEPWATIWTSINDGSGSGLDADTLDGFHASAAAAAQQIPVIDINGDTHLDAGVDAPGIKLTDYVTMSRMYSGADSVFGHNVYAYKTGRNLKLGVTSWPASWLRMFQNGIFFGLHASGTAGDTVCSPSGGDPDSNEVIHIDANGVLKLLKGQLSFPATQNDSEDVNTLDDYEEGTCTLTLTGTTHDPDTPVTVTAQYVKIGKTVTLNFNFYNVDTTGATGYAKITGQPWNPVDGTAGGTLFFAAGYASGCNIYMTSEWMYVVDPPSTAVQTISAAAGRYLAGTITYKIA